MATAAKETTKPAPKNSGAIRIAMRKLDELAPYERNARTHSAYQVEQIARSITEFGFTNPVLIDEDGGIIAGHGRVEAAKLLDLAKVPTITLAGLTADQKRAYILADNKLALNAGWDEDLLRSELQAMGDFDLSLIGFNEDELAAILAEPTDGDTDPDVVPDLPAKPTSALGDVWLLGAKVKCPKCGKTTPVGRAAR